MHDPASSPGGHRPRSISDATAGPLKFSYTWTMFTSPGLNPASAHSRVATAGWKPGACFTALA